MENKQEHERLERKNIAGLSHGKSLVIGPLLVPLPRARTGTMVASWWPLGCWTLRSAAVADGTMLIKISKCSFIFASLSRIQRPR